MSFSGRLLFTAFDCNTVNCKLKQEMLGGRARNLGGSEKKHSNEFFKKNSCVCTLVHACVYGVCVCVCTRVCLRRGVCVCVHTRACVFKTNSM